MAVKDGISGPHLAAAFICERALQEKDGVPSFIRVVERFMVPKFPPGVALPPGMPPSSIQFTLVVILKAGDLPSGRYKVKVALTKPDGMEMPSPENDVFFNGSDENGVAIVTPLGLPNPDEGLHWFNVYFEGKLITRVPMRVLYQQIQFGQVPGAR